MGIAHLLKLMIDRIYGKKQPVRRTGRDKVRVILNDKDITLESELMKDELGYFLDVAIPAHCFWSEPKRYILTSDEKNKISDLIIREMPKSDNIRAKVKIY